ncbi:hypothetical protein JCM10908_003862 [Rhodotorula pacifica]|uniref:uncharacterized protein n=1 Tax=Rhodotorula pacifica TaxID=1495444 RepID=UPI00316F0C16
MEASLDSCGGLDDSGLLDSESDARADRLSAAQEAARRQGLLDPRPSFAIPVPFPAPPPHLSLIPYTAASAQTFSSDTFLSLLAADPHTIHPHLVKDECCTAPMSICDELRQIGHANDSSRLRNFFGAFEPDFMLLDMSDEGKAQRSQMTETVKLGPEFIGEWDAARKRWSPVSNSNPHLHRVRPGHVLVVVDESNLSHFEIKAAGVTGAVLRRIAHDQERTELQRGDAQQADADILSIQAEARLREYAVYAPPAGQPKGPRTHRRVGYHEYMSIINPGGNSKGSNSHTVGPTNIDMATTPIAQPPPIWRISDPAILTRAHDDLAQAKRLYASFVRQHRRLAALRGRVCFRLARLILPERVFSVLADRAHIHGGLRAGCAENFTSTTCQMNILPLGLQQPTDPSSTGKTHDKGREPEPPDKDSAVTSRILSIASGLGSFFGQLHIDTGDDNALFTTIVPESDLPRGSTLGAFLMAEFGTVIDLLSYDEESGKDDYTIAIISGDTSHVGSDVCLAPLEEDLAVGESDSAAEDPSTATAEMLFRAVSVNYASWASSAASPVIPLSPGAILSDPHLYRANIPVVVALPNGDAAATWGNDECARFVIAQARAREALREAVYRRLLEDNDIATGAPRSISEHDTTAYDKEMREAFWRAAEAVEVEYGISWRSEWERAARPLRLSSELVEAEASKPNPFGRHGAGWFKRVEAVRHMAQRGVRFRNGIRGWTQMPEEFKTRTGYRRDARSGDFIRDESLPHMLPVPPVHHLVLLRPKLAPSLLRAAGVTLATTTIESFGPNLKRRYEEFRREHADLWQAERDLIKPHRAAHDRAVAAAETRYLDEMAAGADGRAEAAQRAKASERCRDGVVGGRLTETSAESTRCSTSSHGPRAAEPRRWRWRNKAGNEIDRDGRVFATSSRLEPHQLAANEPAHDPAPALSTTPLPSSAAPGNASSLRAAPSRGATTRSGRTSQKRAADAVQAPDIATLTTEPKAKKARPERASGTTSAAKTAETVLALTNPDFESVSPMPRDLHAARTAAVDSHLSSTQPVEALSLIADSLDPAALSRPQSVAFESVLQTLRLLEAPTGGTVTSVTSDQSRGQCIGTQIRHLAELATATTAIQHVAVAFVLEGLGVLADHMARNVWPICIEAGARIEAGSGPLTEREEGVRVYVNTGSPGAFTSGDGTSTWVLSPRSRPAGRSKLRGARAAEQRANLVFTHASVLFDLALLDLLAIGALNSRVLPTTPSVRMSFAGILSVSGTIAEATVDLARQLRYRLALITMFATAASTSAVLLLPTVQAALQDPVAVQRQLGQSRGSAYSLKDVEDWLPAVNRFAETLDSPAMSSALARLNVALDTLSPLFAFAPFRHIRLAACPFPISPAVAPMTRFGCSSPEARFLATVCRAASDETAPNWTEDDHASSDEDTDTDEEDDLEADASYVSPEDVRSAELLRRKRQIAALDRRRALTHNLRFGDNATKSLSRALANNASTLRRTRRKIQMLEAWPINLDWLSTVVTESLFIAHSKHPSAFPFDPASSSTLLARHKALLSTSTGRQLFSDLHAQFDARGLDWGLWLKSGHEVELFSCPDLPPLAPAGTSSATREDRRRRVFTTFCIRGVLVGSTPEVYRVIPADGWLDGAAFRSWLDEPLVQALQQRRSGKDRAWTNGTPYGSWMDLSVFHHWNYDAHTDRLLDYLDEIAAAERATVPSYRAVVALIRTWSVEKTDFAERGETYDERRRRIRQEKARRVAHAEHDDGDLEAEEAAENEEPAASAKSGEAALPILAGELSSLHVASDLVRLGLVAPPSDGEMGSLLDRMKLGASRGLSELGFVRSQAYESTDAASGTTVRLEAQGNGRAFAQFASLVRASLAEDVKQVFANAKIHLSASLLENILCKFSRGAWTKIRKTGDYQAAMADLPPLFDLSDPEWRLRGNPAEVDALKTKVTALAKKADELAAALASVQLRIGVLETM